MCGIAGYIGKNLKEDRLLKMLKAQSHRGPDYTGTYKNKNTFLGHNRLSIIDLSEESNQPFLDNSKRYSIIFNGEIYNYLELKEELKEEYIFNTSSDTEVLLAAFIKWGKDCLHHLNGMFSFAIWDKLEEKLFAARDRFGVKPFYYSYKDSTFVFASEIKALHVFGIKKSPNKKVWANYFSFGSYGLPNETFWEEIQQLPGSYFLEYKKGQLNVEKWYFFEKEIEKQKKGRTLQEVEKEYTALLKDSISLRFRADVPVGFNISGGLDSSVLLAFVNILYKKNTQNIKGYTFYTNDERYDELPWVEEMISLTNNPLTKVLLESSEVKELSINMSVFQDEPYGGLPTIAYSKIFKKAKEEGTVVLLDGQGMDEQWAGYDYYMQNNNATIQGVNSSPFRKNVLSKEILEYAEKPIYDKPFKDELLNKQYRDLFYTKIPRALRFNDRISMAHSRELREPFLDYRLVEYAFSLPKEFKINKGIQKFVLRNIVSKHLSDNISFAPKRPLQTPQREWIGDELYDFIYTKIVSLKNTKEKTWFDFNEIEKELKDYKKGNRNSSFHIWQWLNFSLLIE